jgi:NADH-quinone oxidoreductase subunit E
MSTVETLSVVQRDAIKNIIVHAIEPRAAVTDVLRYVQNEMRFIDDRVLGEVAPLLGMSSAELDEVATFYNLIFRRPVGERVLFLCNSVTCWMLGQPQLQAYLQAQLGIRPGETTTDGKVTLLPIVCLGHCDHAPAMLLGDVLHGKVTCDRLDELLCLERALWNAR